MLNEQIKHMVDRFLGWKLPENFCPDAGISFKATFNEHTAHPMKYEPCGTNLFDATQADAMVRYMIEGIPDDAPALSDAEVKALKALAHCARGDNPYVSTYGADATFRIVADLTMRAPSITAAELKMLIALSERIGGGKA